MKLSIFPKGLEGILLARSYSRRNIDLAEKTSIVTVSMVRVRTLQGWGVIITFAAKDAREEIEGKGILA